MTIALYFFLGILFFDCLLVCCLYFRKESYYSRFWIEAELTLSNLNKTNSQQFVPNS